MHFDSTTGQVLDNPSNNMDRLNGHKNKMHNGTKMVKL